ncbi:FAD/NAD(P)-binding protein [Rhodanobacter sp. Si-c]|uniref:FAD/NAD(P)-binding protein n=1 Tax=Rhodanobacter lycopersici TaxID=3162487 RepID=A0ABV3QD65_9GAMM
MTDIAIIGGGAAGAAVFGELLRRPDRQGAVHWITGCQAPGRGVAYATRDEHHLLNVRAAGMGLFADQKDDFLQHASRSLGHAQGIDFLPRRLFGEFIQAQVHARMSEAQAHGARFHLHHAKALSVQRTAESRYRIGLEHGDALTVDAAVLAIGALAPRALRTVSVEALNSGAYMLDPWNQDEPARPPRRVLVIGTGLTAVDTLISAATRWPRAELVAVSRHGLLPFRHQPVPLAPYPYQDDLNAALLACDGAAPMMRLVREAMANAPGTDWRAVIDGMRPVNAKLWQALTLAQRRQFLRHVRWAWEASRHRTAPASFETVQALIDSGRLQVHAARVLAVDGRGPLAVTVRSRATQLMSTIEADRVLQATGLDTAVAYARDPLLAQLLDEGVATPDPLQLGIAAEPDGRLLDARGQPQPRFYGIGSLLRGNLWECTAMPEIRTAANRLARALAEPGDAADLDIAARA